MLTLRPFTCTFDFLGSTLDVEASLALMMQSVNFEGPVDMQGRSLIPFALLNPTGVAYCCARSRDSTFVSIHLLVQAISLQARNSDFRLVGHRVYDQWWTPCERGPLRASNSRQTVNHSEC
jgi:hypothetical protein